MKNKDHARATENMLLKCCSCLKFFSSFFEIGLYPTSLHHILHKASAINYRPSTRTQGSQSSTTSCLCLLAPWNTRKWYRKASPFSTSTTVCCVLWSGDVIGHAFLATKNSIFTTLWLLLFGLHERWREQPKGRFKTSKKGFVKLVRKYSG